MDFLSREPLIKVCTKCGKSNPKMAKCPVCKETFKKKTYYCSKECQKNDWPQHKSLHCVSRVTKAVTGVDGTDEHGVTELMEKACVGDLEAVKALVASNCDKIMCVDNQGCSVLNYAIFGRSADIVDFFCSKSPDLLKLKGPSIWKRSSCLMQASFCGSLRIVQVLFKHGGQDLLFLTDNDGRTCLHQACKHGRLDVVKFLVTAGGIKLINQLDLDGRSCTSGACEEGHISTVKYLIDVGGDGLLLQSGPDNLNCLMVAMHNGHGDLAKLLIKVGGKRLVEMVTSDYCSVLYFAAFSNLADVAREALKVAGPALLPIAKLPEGVTCLHVAAERGYTEVIRVLLKMGGGDLMKKQVNTTKDTPVHMAAMRGHTRALVELLGSCPLEVLELQNTQHYNPFLMTCELGHADAARLLVRRHPSLLVSRGGPAGGTAMHLAAAWGRVEVLRVLLDARRAMPGLVAGSLEDPLCLRDDKANTPLHAACILGQAESVKVLIETGGDIVVGALAMDGVSCLDLARMGGNAKIVGMIEAYITAAGGFILNDLPSAYPKNSRAPAFHPRLRAARGGKA